MAGEVGVRARELGPHLATLLTEGAVTRDSLLDMVPKILTTVRAQTGQQTGKQT